MKKVILSVVAILALSVLVGCTSGGNLGRDTVPLFPIVQETYTGTDPITQSPAVPQAASPIPQNPPAPVPLLPVSTGAPSNPQVPTVTVPTQEQPPQPETPPTPQTPTIIPPISIPPAIESPSIPEEPVVGLPTVETPTTEEPLVETPTVEEPHTGETVYVTDTGKCYHLAGCQYLKESCIPILLSEAKKRYRECSKCF